MRIYLTHCSAKKDDSLKYSDICVTPDKLYTAKPTQRFMNKCKRMGVRWAIFSDLYGVWSPEEKHKWYNKHPNTVNDNKSYIQKRITCMQVSSGIGLNV